MANCHSCYNCYSWLRGHGRAQQLFADLPPEVLDGFSTGLSQVLDRLRALQAGKSPAAT